MSANTRGLGRGLDALFQNNVEAAEAAPASITGQAGAQPQKLKIMDLVPSPHQPRRHFSEQQMEELTASIKSQGVLQPILVRPRGGSEGQYEIVAGERRWRAAKQAGLSSVPVVIKDMNDQEVLIVALMENLQREDLTPMEEALGLQQLKEEFGLSQEDMAHRLGKSRSGIANTLRLLALPETARNDLMEGRITAGHARALLMVTDPASQETFRDYMVRGHCTVREAESIASLWKETGALPDDLTPGGKQAGQTRKAANPNTTLLALQEKLSGTLSLPVTIRGKESKGTISLKYGSKDELASFLERLGLAGELNA